MDDIDRDPADEPLEADEPDRGSNPSGQRSPGREEDLEPGQTSGRSEPGGDDVEDEEPDRGTGTSTEDDDLAE